MPELPTHSDTSGTTSKRNEEDFGPTPPKWRRYVVIGVIVAALLAMILLHVTGVVGPQTN